MPIVHDDFDKYKQQTSAADRAALNAMGMACLQVAMPTAPVKTGNLRRSHTTQLNGDSVLVGVMAEYGGYVHNGTSRQKAQPWLKNAVNRNKEAITKLGAEVWAQKMR